MLLEGKTGLVLNATNKHSIGWAIAELAHQHGARVGVGAQNQRLLEGVDKMIAGRERFETLTIDFLEDGQYALLAEQVANKLGKLDFFVHSVGYAPKEALAGRFIDTSEEDFLIALNASAYSLIRTCKEIEPFLNEDASIITLSYLGSTRAMLNYNIMGVAKAALESAVRYLAMDLGDRGIRVNTVSPGPVNTISGRGVKGLSAKIEHVRNSAPLKRPYGQEEAAKTSLYLLSELSYGVTGQVFFVDSGYSVVGS